MSENLLSIQASISDSFYTLTADESLVGRGKLLCEIFNQIVLFASVVFLKHLLCEAVLYLHPFEPLND